MLKPIQAKIHYTLLFFLLAIIPFLIGIVYLIGFNKQASAAVQFDRQSTMAASDLSWQHTTSNNPNRLLIVSISHDTGERPTRVTYNGINLTLLSSQRYDGTSVSTSDEVTLWYLVNPPVGTYTIALTAEADDFTAASGSTFYNINQTTPFVTVARSTGSGGSPSLSIATDTTQLVVSTFGARTTPGLGSGQTLLWNVVTLLSNTGSSKPGQAGTTQLSWSTSEEWAAIAVAINSASVPTPTPTLTPTPTRTPTPIPPTPTPTIVTKTCTIVSDTTDAIEEGGATVATYTGNPNWTASIPGATWIWSSFLVANPSVQEIKTFAKDMNVTLPVTNAVLEIASDNNYTFFLNGTQLFADTNDTPILTGNFNARTKDTYTFTSNFKIGRNTIEARVTNLAIPGSTPQTNPAGLLYKLTVTAADCESLVTYKIDGNVFKDDNKNGQRDTGEIAYAGTPNISASRGTVTTRPDGTYTISNLTAGLVTVSYSSLPAGYSMTYPLNGPPPSFQVTVGPACNPNGALGTFCF